MTMYETNNNGKNVYNNYKINYSATDSSNKQSIDISIICDRDGYPLDVSYECHNLENNSLIKKFTFSNIRWG